MQYSKTQRTQKSDFTDKKAKYFGEIAEEIFAPIYPVIADNIYGQTDITSGRCIDIGAGPGHLGLAIGARNPHLQVVLYDPSEDMLTLAKENSLSVDFSHRITLQRGSAEQLPFSDNSTQLIVSRGSIFFWEDQIKALNEIYRVLAPNGCACIGGGFGNDELLRKVQEKMQVKDPDWDKKRKERIGSQGVEHFTDKLKKSIIIDYTISQERAGLWIFFKK